VGGANVVFHLGVAGMEFFLYPPPERGRSTRGSAEGGSLLEVSKKMAPPDQPSLRSEGEVNKTAKS